MLGNYAIIVASSFTNHFRDLRRMRSDRPRRARYLARSSKGAGRIWSSLRARQSVRGQIRLLKTLLIAAAVATIVASARSRFTS